MGLASPALRFLIREHMRRPFCGPLLTLGRQAVDVTLSEAEQLIRREGMVPESLPGGENIQTNIPKRIGSPFGHYTSDVAFFKLMGLPDLHVLDYSAHESADLIADLNLPIPDHLKNRFDLIIDGGTLEHVFDVKQAFINVASMLKVGGRIIHMSPANNYVNHGFYQLSPTLFFDYYGANQFSDLRGYVVVQDKYYMASRPWEFYELNPREHSWISSEHLGQLLMVFFVAEKQAQSSVGKVPIQSYYSQEYQRAGNAQTHRVSRQYDSLWERVLPLLMFTRLLPLSLKSFVQRRLLGGGKTRRPWGLRRWGVL